MVDALIEAGADVNAVVPYDETPLITAVRAGQFEIVQCLVEGLKVRETREPNLDRALLAEALHEFVPMLLACPRNPAPTDSPTRAEPA